MTKTKRWKPEKGMQYFLMDADGGIGSYIWEGDGVDRTLYEIGNCFRTKEEAKAASEKVKYLLLGLNEPVAECNRLPKLTAEVFNHPDCPEWAKYAAVNANGKVVLFSDIPNCRDNGWSVIWHSTSTQDDILDDVLFDSSDWKNSLIERPAILPDWCKVGSYVWSDRYGYFEISYINEVSKHVHIRQCNGGTVAFLRFNTIINYSNEARLRPYHEDEMKALVGKSITFKDGAVCLCTAWAAQRKQIILDNASWTAEGLLNVGYTIDGKPCGVYEHLNDEGEWVE